MLAAPDARLFREKTSLGGVATVVSAANLHKFIFTSTGLPALADAKVYELWIMGPGGKATRAGLLAAIAGGKTAPVLAVMEVPPENISAYGAIDGEPISHNGTRDRVYRIRDLVEKPKASEAPSNLAIIGRYVLIPEIFQSLLAIEPGAGAELQLTDALRHLLRTRPIYAYRFEGTRYDAGDKLGFLKATVEFALRRHDLGGPFREYLKNLQL